MQQKSTFSETSQNLYAQLFKLRSELDETREKYQKIEKENHDLLTVSGILILVLEISVTLLCKSSKAD